MDLLQKTKNKKQKKIKRSQLVNVGRPLGIFSKAFDQKGRTAIIWGRIICTFSPSINFKASCTS